MISYVNRSDGSIEKWNVEFFEDYLLTIREEVINNCSSIRYCSYALTEEQIKEKMQDPHIRNLVRKQEEEEGVYRVNFEVHDYPRLVGLIDRVFDGDVLAIEEIQYPTEVGNKYFDEKVQRLSCEIDFISNFSIDLKIRKLEELGRLIDRTKRNKLDLLESYYERVESAINATLLKYLEPNEVEYLEDFFDISLKNLVDKKVKKKTK